jgi:hypothetical protein
MALDSKKFLKTLTVGRGSILTPHIDAYQRRGVFPDKWDVEIRNTKENDGHFHPSGDCLVSAKDLYLSKKGLLLPQPITPALRRTFDCGHMWHGYIQNILIDMGFVTPENVENHTVHKIVRPSGTAIGSGTGDLVDVQIPGQGSWLVDIKTMRKDLFDQGADDLTLAKWAAQVNCYGDWFNQDKMMILAICKDSPHNFREYIIERDDALLEEIYEKWIYVTKCIKKGVEPDDS